MEAGATIQEDGRWVMGDEVWKRLWRALSATLHFKNKEKEVWRRYCTIL